MKSAAFSLFASASEAFIVFDKKGWLRKAIEKGSLFAWKADPWLSSFGGALA